MKKTNSLISKLVLLEKATVTIQSLAFGGDGIARTPDGFVLFISGGVPGDVVEVQITERKKKFGTAKILKILEKSPDRRTAPCPVFGICGGCQTQNMHYPSQLKFKNEMIQGALRKTHFPLDNLRSIVASPAEFHYRNRIQVRTQDGEVGFYQRLSHKIAPITECLVAVEPINVALKNLPRKPDRKVELKLLRDGKVIQDENAEHGENLGFSQVNAFANELMVAAVVEQTNLNSRLLWDLYAGDGNFTWPLAERSAAAKVEAVEFNRTSVTHANTRALKENKSDRIHFHHAKVEDWLKIQLKSSRKLSPDLVLLDPPRMGCETSVIESLLKLRPKKIIFIGCDLNHFIRDVKPLLEIYDVQELIPFDLFPQTFHVEMVAVLSVRDA